MAEVVCHPSTPTPHPDNLWEWQPLNSKFTSWLHWQVSCLPELADCHLRFPLLTIKLWNVKKLFWFSTCRIVQIQQFYFWLHIFTVDTVYIVNYCIRRQIIESAVGPSGSHTYWVVTMVTDSLTENLFFISPIAGWRIIHNFRSGCDVAFIQLLVCAVCFINSDPDQDISCLNWFRILN